MTLDEFKREANFDYCLFIEKVRAYIADFKGGYKDKDLQDYEYYYCFLAILINENYDCSSILKKYCTLNYKTNNLNFSDLVDFEPYSYRFIPSKYNNENIDRLTPTKLLIYYIENEKEMENVLITNGISTRTPGGPAVIDKTKLNELIKELKEISNIEDNKYNSEILNIFCKKMEADAINFFECAGRLYQLITEQEKDIKVIGLDDESKKVLAAFIALFLFKDTSKKTSYDEAIVSFFKERNLTLENILNLINLKIDNINDINPAPILKDKFQKYSGYSGNFYYFYKNIFYDNSINDVTLKKLLTELNVDYNSMNELSNLIYNITNNQSSMTKKEYDEKVQIDVIKYLEDVYRIYKVLNSNKDNVNSEVIEDEKDIVVLSFLIKAYLCNSRVSKYFSGKGIKLEDIYNITGTPVEISKLNDIVIDEKEIVIKILNNLNNFSNRLEYITINDIDTFIVDYDKVKTKVLNRMVYIVTGNTLPVVCINDINSYISKIEKLEFETKVERVFHGMKSDVYNYLTYVSFYYSRLCKYNLQGKNAEAISLILGLSNFSFYYNYLSSTKSLNFSNIKNNYNASDVSNSIELDIDAIESHFLPFIFDGYNKNKKREEITIDDIVSNSVNKELNDSFQFEQFLNKYNIDRNWFNNLSNSINEYDKQRKEIDSKKFMDCLINKSTVIAEVLTISTKINEDLNNKINNLRYINKDDIDTLSPLIAFFLMDNNKYKVYFENEGINLNYILNYIGYSLEELKSINFKKISNVEIVDKYNSFIAYDLSPSFKIEKNSNKVIGHIQDYQYLNLAAFGRRIFNNSFSGSNVLERIISNYEKYKRIKKNFEEENPIVYLIPAKEVIEDLEKQINKDIVVDVTSTDSITDFLLTGDNGLSKYSEYIQAQITEITSLINGDNSIEKIGEMVGQIYIDTPIKQGLINRIFKSDKQVERKVNSNILTRINDEIDLGMDNIAIQVKKYREIYKVITLYVKALIKYKNESVTVKEYLENNVKPKYDNNEEYYSELLELTQLLDTLNNKIVGYDRSLLLMKQQQVQIIQAINNHMSTMDALQSSKNDIIPIIGSEMLFRLGNATETNALELSNNLVSLFKNIISGNPEAARRSLEMIQASSLPQETVDKLIADFSNYIDSPIENNEDNKVKVKTNTQNNKMRD